jgi:hypothetical protein
VLRIPTRAPVSDEADLAHKPTVLAAPVSARPFLSQKLVLSIKRARFEVESATVLYMIRPHDDQVLFRTEREGEPEDRFGLPRSAFP